MKLIQLQGLNRAFMVLVVLVIGIVCVKKKEDGGEVSLTCICSQAMEATGDFWTQPQGHYSESQCYSIGIFQVVRRGCVEISSICVCKGVTIFL